MGKAKVNRETRRYMGVTFVVNKEAGSHFRNEYFSREFPLDPSLIDYCLSFKEKNYLKTRKRMIVLGKLTPEEETILFDESDKVYSTITFLYQSEDLSNPKLVACDVLTKKIKETIREDKLLNSILKGAVLVLIGRYLFQGSEEEQSALDLQDRHIEVHCENFHDVKIITDKMTYNRIPSHDCWKNANSLHKIIADKQSQEGLRFFYQEKFSTLIEKVKDFRVKAPLLLIDHFYQHLHFLEKEVVKVKHKMNTASLETDLAEVKSGYESQSLLIIQKSLSNIQRRSLHVSVFSVILSVCVIAAVGYFQMSVTKEVGLRQASIMETQTEIMRMQAETQIKEFDLLTSRYLTIVSWEPFPLLVTEWREQGFLKVIVRNPGNIDIVISNIFLVFPCLNGSEFTIKVSDFDPQFESITIERFSTKEIRIPVNPYANENIRGLISDEFLNRDLHVTVQIQYSEVDFLHLTFRLTITTKMACLLPI